MEGTGYEVTSRRVDRAMRAKNLLELPPGLPPEEWLETLLERKGIRVERIISTGQSSPVGFWYDQTEDEWLVLLSGTAVLQWENGDRTELVTGDSLLIPAGKKHRVDSTSTEPACVWLAIFVPAGA